MTMARPRTWRIRSACATVALLIGSGRAAGYPLPARAATGTSGVVTASMDAGPYALLLRIGPVERMYTRDEARRQQPTSGEVMLRGTMAMGGMGTGGRMPNHHLEVHVHLRSTGAVVATATVAITVETPAGKALVQLPIAVMRGVAAGPADTHYGNNVWLKGGRYTVVVRVGHTTGAFEVTLGRPSMAM